MILVVSPISLVCLASDVCKLSVSVGVTKIPVTFIRCSISEVHDTLAMAQASQPLSFIRGARSPILILIYNELLIELCFICVLEYVQLYYSPLAYSL